MSAVGSIGVAELMVILCACCVPVIVVAGVVIGLLVFIARRRPEPALEPAPPQASVPTPRVDPLDDRDADPSPRAKAVTVSDLALKSCPSCGADNPADNSFCEYCGASLGEK
jgi:hypothetical protein